jgi:hypothetical protein
MRAYRMQPASEDRDVLLRPEGQWTEPWGDSEDGAPCDKCGGEKRVDFTCWSCALTEPRADCPVCSGRVRWTDTCPVCRGSGRVEAAPRRGVSAFPTREGLYHYMLEKDADLDGCVVLALEAERSAEVDFDADQGALLVIPTRILACSGIDETLRRKVER